MVTLASNWRKNEMRSIIIRLKDYLERKELELNVEKTKIMRFRKGRGKIEKKDGNGKGKRNGGSERI